MKLAHILYTLPFKNLNYIYYTTIPTIFQAFFSNIFTKDDFSDKIYTSH